MTLGYCRAFALNTISILFAISLASTCVAQQATVLAPHKPIAPRVLKSQELPLPPGKLGSVVGGPWMTDANFKSAIYLKNVIETSAVTVTPVLYLSNGTRYALPDVTLQPAGTAIVDINSGLQSLGIASYATLSGYVEIQYKWPWVPICAMVRNVDTAHSLIFLYGLESLPTALPAASRAQSVQILEGMWWKQEANVTGFASLTNTSPQPIAAAVQVSDNQGATIADHNVTISPNGTKIVNLQELRSIAQPEGGIRVSFSGPPGVLLASGGLEDPSVGYSAGLHFVAKEATSKARSGSVTELGLMAGAADPMMLFPAGTRFTPYSIVRNTSGSAAVVKPTLWWMQAGSARSFQFPALNLRPYQTQSLDLPAMFSAAGLKNWNVSVNVVFDVQGTHDGLLFSAGSVDQTNTYVFEVIPRGVGESGGKSLSYWSTANGDDTMVSLWNPADEAQDLVFKLFFSDGHYAFPVHLEPRDSRMFNVSEIIQNQVPDAEGNIIPASVHDGSAAIVGSRGDNEQILIAFDSGIYNVVKAICGPPPCYTCNGATSTTGVVAANPFGLGARTQTQLKFTTQWNTGVQYDLTTSSSWNSSNTSVATVQTGLVQGVSSGSPTISASVSDYVYAQQVCSYNSNPCPVAPQNGSSPGSVCDFTIIPTTSHAQNCTGSSQNTNAFNAIVVPSASACPVNQTQSTCSLKFSGNIDPVVGTPNCQFSAGPPAEGVSYFAGPKRSDGTAGTLNPSFDLVFFNTSVTEAGSSTVVCP